MRILDKIEEIILVLALLAMTIIAFANIISRNFGQVSLSFTEELTINLFVLLTFVGTAMGVRNYSHLGFTLLYDLGGKGVKRSMIAISTIAGLVLFGVLFWYGIQTILFQVEMGQKTPALGWPTWVMTLSLPIGAILCIVRTIQVGWQEWQLKEPTPTIKEGEVL